MDFDLYLGPIKVALTHCNSRTGCYRGPNDKRTVPYGSYDPWAPSNSIKLYTKVKSQIHGWLSELSEPLNSSFCFLTSDQPGGGYLGPKLHPRGGFIGPWFFIILKNSHQDPSNEGLNFILNSLEVGHWGLKHSHFWQITTNQRFWLLTTISEYGKIVNLLNSQCHA